MNDKTMLEEYTELQVKSDMGMYYCGKRINTPNHEYGPEIRSHYLFVLVNKGKAQMLSHKQITFGEHDLLIMLPGEKIHYKALEKWSISWLGLYGETITEYIDMLCVKPEKPIIHISTYNELKAVMDKIYNLSKETTSAAKLSIVGLIYEFFSLLLKCSGHNVKTDAINTALKIIDYNYCANISVEQIAENLSVNPSYFSRRFAQTVGASPKQYITEKRIERAKELLISTNASVFEVSNSVGYEDQFYFCRIFKKYAYMSPSEYRKKNHLS